MRPNGEVVAMVGGRDYATSAFNRVTQAPPPAGFDLQDLRSISPALDAGWDPDDTIPNTRNHPRQLSSEKTRAQPIPTRSRWREAFAQSSNVAAVRLLQAVGSDKVIAEARALGITVPMAEGDPSLALGTSAMTLMELDRRLCRNCRQ